MESGLELAKIAARKGAMGSERIRGAGEALCEVLQKAASVNGFGKQ